MEDPDVDKQIRERIDALTEADWNELEEIYRELQDHKGPFSIEKGGDKNADGSINMPWTEGTEITEKVRKFLYDKNLMVPFNWPDWQEGRDMFKVEGADRFNDISAVDVIKLFFAVLRNARFSEGAFESLFESGSAQLLIKRLLDFNPYKK